MSTRHRLAIVIASIMADQACAESLSVIGNPLQLADTYTNSIDLVGEAHTTEPLLTAWISATGTFQGGLNNHATVTVSGPTAGTISGNGALYLQSRNSSPASIQGDFVQAGSLQASNIADATVYVGKANISGKFSNQGTISQSNTLGALSPTLDNYNLLIDQSTLGGGFENSGVIHSQGDDFQNLVIENSKLYSFSNSGTISADGARSVAMLFGQGNKLLNTSDDVLYNRGTISAKGQGSIALKVESGLGVENAGLIQADGTAVDLSQTSIYYTQEDGLTAGGQIALLGNFSPDSTASSGTLASFDGGAVQGDIRNMWVTEVDGNVAMDSALIQTRYLELGGGRLTLLRPHTVLEGNLELIGSEMELTLSRATEQNRPILKVTGEAEVDPGSRILLTPKPNDFSTQGDQRYQLISASRWYQLGQESVEVPISASELSVASTSALLTVNSHEFEGNTLVANLRAITGEEAGQIVAEEGASVDAQTAIGELSGQIDKLLPTDPIFEQIANADAGQIAKFAESLYPEVNGGANAAAISQQRQMENAVRQRGMALRQLPDNLDKGGVWVQGLDGHGSQGRRQDITGFDMNASGIAAGADAVLAPGLIAGLAYGYMDGNVKSHNGNKTDIDGNALTLYGSYQQGGYFVDANLSYGWSENHSKRYIADTRAKGNYHGKLAGMSLLAGYDFALAHALVLEPRVGARYSNIRLDNYDESGSSAALHVNSQRYERGELGAGLRVAGALPAGKGQLVPEASLMAWHDLIGDRTSTTSSFLIGGGDFETTGVRLSRDSYEAALGLDYRLGAVSLGGGYRYEGSKDFNGRNLEARLRYDF